MTDTTISMDVVTADGRAAKVEFRVQPESVEIWHHGRCAAVMNRGLFRAWLWHPDPPMVIDDFSFVADVGDRIRIVLPDVSVWTVPPSVEGALWLAI